MLSQRVANIIFAVFILITSAYFAWVAQGFETSGLLASSGLPSKFFPQLMLGGIAICAVVVLYLYGVKGEAGGDKDAMVFDTPSDSRRGFLMLVVAVVSYIIWRELGFIFMAVLMGPLSLMAMGVRSIWIYLIVLGLTGVVYLVFTELLNVALV